MAATAAIVTVEDLGELPAPTPARPRVLLIATSLVTAASVMLFAGLLGVYFQQRASVLAAGDRWLPEGVDIPLTPANMSLIGFAISCVTMQWAVDAIGRDDRRHTWLAFGATFIVAAFHAVGMGFLYSQVGLAVSSTQGALFYALTGGHLVMLAGATLFAALMAFRTLGGQYSAKDREGVVAAAVYWYATVAVYVAIWYGVLVTK